MATRLRIVLVTCLLVFILMDANPVLAKKGGGKFKQLEARVKELEKSVGGEDECKGKYTKRMTSEDVFMIMIIVIVITALSLFVPVGAHGRNILLPCHPVLVTVLTVL